ncbi:MAG: YlmH/Sll1252 family protein [Pelosinus sp.]|nr:YlmH/Sll1252 family protein [Pelosinus sp.]
MADRDKILRYYRASGEEEQAARLLDLAEIVERNHKYKVSEFLDPYGFSIAETIAAHYGLKLMSDGGYLGAERIKAAFVAEEFPGKVDFGLKAIQAVWDFRYNHISHRDMLGALMGLGVKREVLGDIIMTGEACQIIVDSTMAGFVLANFTQAGSAAVSLSEILLTDIVPRVEKIKEIKTTLASLRLDVVAAAGFGVSRSKMAEDIAAEKIKVNWQDAKSSSQSVKAGDIISTRGRGRVEVCEIFGQTKKGRTSVLLKRFM